MKELEKILEEIDQKSFTNMTITHNMVVKMKDVRTIIRKHMNAGERFEFDFTNVKSFDCQCGRHYVNTGTENNGGWIPVDKRLPEKNEYFVDTSSNKDFPNGYYRRLEIAYMTDTVEYIYGYYDGYKWMDKYLDAIKNVVAWRIHEPYRPERSNRE